MNEKVVVCRDKGCHAHAPLERARTIAVALEQEVALRDRQLDMARAALDDLWAEKLEGEGEPDLSKPWFSVPHRPSRFARVRSWLRTHLRRKRSWEELGWQEVGYSTDEPELEPVLEAEIICGSSRHNHECSLPDGHDGVHFCGSHACKERWVEYNTPDNLLRSER